MLAQAVGDVWDEAKSLFTLAQLHRGYSQSQESDYFERLLVLFREFGELAIAEKVLINYSSAYLQVEQYFEAIRILETAVAITQELDDHQSYLQYCYSLGEAYFANAQYAQAIETYQHLKSFAQSQGDQRLEAEMLLSMGTSYARLNQLSHAHNFLQQALSIYRALEERKGEADCLCNIGHLYALSQQYNQVLDCIEQALKIYQDLGDRDNEMACLRDIASTYFSLEQPENAIDPLQQQLKLTQEIGDRSMDVLTHLGLAHLSSNEFKQLLHHVERLRKAATPIKVTQADVSHVPALQYLQQALSLSRTICDQAAESNLLGIIYALSEVQQSSPENSKSKWQFWR